MGCPVEYGVHGITALSGVPNPLRSGGDMYETIDAVPYATDFVRRIQKAAKNCYLRHHTYPERMSHIHYCRNFPMQVCHAIVFLPFSIAR